MIKNDNYGDEFDYEELPHKIKTFTDLENEDDDNNESNIEEELDKIQAFENFDDEDFSEIKIEDPNLDEESDFDIYYKMNTNSHRQEGKHSLKRDTIFYGKKNDPELDNELYLSEMEGNSDISIERGTDFEYESKHYIDYMTKKSLSEDVYRVLKENTSIDFKSNRRKPNKQVFNDYYRLLLKELSLKYKNYEIFSELSYYFTDNTFNMFKLLEIGFATKIINELKEAGYLDGLDNIRFI